MVNSSTPQAVSTLLRAGPGSPVASVSRHFHSPRVLTAPASARSQPPPHLPDSEVGLLGIPVSTGSGVSVTAGGSSAVSASALGLSGLAPSVVPATNASGIPATPRPSSDVPTTGASGASTTDNVVSASGFLASTALGIPVTIFGATQPSSMLLCPPRRLPDHEPCTSTVSVPRASDPGAPLTRGGTDVFTGYNGCSLDIHRTGTPSQQAPLTQGGTDTTTAFHSSLVECHRTSTHPG